MEHTSIVLIKLIKKKVINRAETTAIGLAVMVKLNKIDEAVISTLKTTDKGLTLTEIAEGVGESEKKVYRSLRKLFENEMIDCRNRQYRLVSP